MKKQLIGIVLLVVCINVHSQNVGIGTNTPQQKLDVNGMIKADSGIIVNNIMVFSSDGKLNSDTGLFKRVGVNINPAFPLDVNGLINTNTGYNIGGSFALRYGAYNTLLVGVSGYGNGGQYNTMVGQGAGGFNSSTSNDNTFIGSRAAMGNTTGQYNTVVGSSAGEALNSGSNNVLMGYQAGTALTTASFNTFIGTRAGPLVTDGTSNVFIGSYAANNTSSGNENVFVGYVSGSENTTGSRNTLLGIAAGFLNHTGVDNTCIGNKAGFNNDLGSFNTIIGSTADVSVSGITNSTAIGYQAQVTASNQVRIGNSSITSIGGYQPWSNLSDGRFKKDLQENVPGLSFINKLRPVTYLLDFEGVKKQELKQAGVKSIPASFKSPALNINSNKRFTGFVAQEVERSAVELKYEFDGVDAPKNEQDFYSLRYSEFVVPLVKAVQELSTQNGEKEKMIAELRKKTEELTMKNKTLEMRLLKIEERINQ